MGGHVTTIVIAHRLSTIKDADNIVVMDKGKIVEVGNHGTLLKDYPDGIYAKFVKESEKAEGEHRDLGNDIEIDVDDIPSPDQS